MIANTIGGAFIFLSKCSSQSTVGGTRCWTSCQATSPSCIAEGHQPAPVNTKPALDRSSATLTARTGPSEPPVETRRNRRVRWSSGSSRSFPCPWLRNAENCGQTFPSFVHIKRCQKSNVLSSKYCVVLNRAKRLKKTEDLSSWRQWRQSSRVYVRRLKEAAEVLLSSLQLWRGDIHQIEGEGTPLKSLQ